MPLFAQEPTINVLDIERVIGVSPAPPVKAMPCTPASSPITILSCEGETPVTGDDNPANGAFMEWIATGTSGLYYSRIYNGPDTFQIVQPGTSNTVFTPNEPDGVSFRGRLSIAGAGTPLNACLAPGSWTVQVWDVMDADGDLQPDRDLNGNIIGCFTECTYTFFPSCPSVTNPPYTIDYRDIGCNGFGGYVRLVNFRTPNLYCVDQDGGGATYSWRGPNGFSATTRDINNLAPGIYTVSVMDFYGCTTFWTQAIAELDNVAMTCAPVSAPSTFGANDAVISVDITAGSSDYSMSWTGPVPGTNVIAFDGPNQIAGLPAGTYTITVTDNVSTCEETCTVVIPDPPCALDFTVSENALGDIVLTIIDGTPDFFVSYTGPTSQGDIGPFGGGGTTLSGGQFDIGMYTFTVYESERPDCRATRPLTIPGPDCSDLSFTLDALSQISCAGANDGRLSVSIGGDHNPVLRWTGPNVNGSNTTSLVDLVPGTYAYELTDERGCFLEGDFTITAPPTLLFTCGSADESSPSLDDGRIWLDLTGGTPGYRLAYTAIAPDGNPLPGLADLPVSTGDTLFGLPAGRYQLQLTDANGCTAACTTVIDQPVCTLAVSGNRINATCFGAEDGAIFLSVTGAGSGLTIDWSEDQYDGQDSLRELPPGIYSVRVSDDSPCPLPPISFEVLEPPAFTVSLAQTAAILCSGETTAALTANVTGGQGMIRYRWNDPLLPDAPTVENLPAGEFALSATDSLGCNANDTLRVAEPAPLSMTCGAAAETGVGRADGQLSFTVAGGTPPYRFRLNGQTIARPLRDTFRMLAPGSYRIEITDGNDCGISCEATVNAGGCGNFSVGTATVQPNCDEATGSATATPMAANGAVSYRWSHGPTTATVTALTPGTYRVTATDVFNCEAIGQLEITPFTDAPAFTPGILAPACEEACSSLDYGAAGLFPLRINYLFSGARTQVQGAVEVSRETGSLTFCPADFGLSSFAEASIRFTSVTAADGCARPLDDLRSFSVFPPAIGRLDTSLCVGDTLRYRGESFFADRPTDELTIPGASANGCDSTVVVALTFFAPARGALDTIICAGDTLRYYGEVFHARRTSGRVRVPQPSANGCDSTVVVQVGFHPPATGVFDTTICLGTSFSIGDTEFDGVATDQLVTLENASSTGCDSTVSVTVRILLQPLVSLASDGFVCADELLDLELTYEGTSVATLELSSHPGEFFRINPGRTRIERQVTVGETVSIRSARDEGPCAPITSGEVTVIGSELGLEIEVTSGDGLYAVSCADDADGSVVAVPTGEIGPYSYAWSNGATTATLEDLPPGPYTLRVTSGRGCEATAEVLLLSPPLLVASIGTLPANCLRPDPELILRDVAGGVEPYMFQINGNGFRPTTGFPDTITAAVGGNRFAIEDANGCAIRENFDFALPPVGLIEVTPDLTVIRRGDSVRLRVLTDLNANRYQITPDFPELITTSSFFVAPDETTTYEITAFNELGCSATTSAKVVVDRYVPVYIPNVFSPNGDGVNDTYLLFGRKEVVSFTNFRIYNRWGQEVYVLDGPVGPGDTNWGWNGNSREGRTHEQGVYVFTVTVAFADGSVQELKGDFALIR